MATLAEMRTRLRLRLEDSTVTPLWSDDELDEALQSALDEYSQWSPEEAVSTATAAAGDTTLAEPAWAWEIVRVVDPNGRIIPRRAGHGTRYVANEELAYETFDGYLRFTQPLAAGDYAIWHLKAYEFPANDAADFPARGGDHSLIVAGAVVYAIEVRMAAEWKRGPLPARYEAMLRAERSELDAAWEARRRRAKVNRLVSDA